MRVYRHCFYKETNPPPYPAHIAKHPSMRNGEGQQRRRKDAGIYDCLLRRLISTPTSDYVDLQPPSQTTASMTQVFALEARLHLRHPQFISRLRQTSPRDWSLQPHFTILLTSSLASASVIISRHPIDLPSRKPSESNV